MEVKPFAFILMPFHKDFDDVYRLGIKAAAEECGVVAERVDEQTFSETILERIYRQIKNSDFIIADMTGQNPNVFYEVGYAHSAGKLCTLITQSTDDIPFDLKHHRHLIYGSSIQNLKELLIPELLWLKNEVSKQAINPITVTLKCDDGLLEKNNYIATANVDFVFDIRNNTDIKSPAVEYIYLITGLGWRFKQDGTECPSDAIPDQKNKIRHFVKSPITRMAPGTWAQIKLSGRKIVGNKYAGEELKDEYKLAGYTELLIYTTEGNFTNQYDVNVRVDEVPF